MALATRAVTPADRAQQTGVNANCPIDDGLVPRLGPGSPCRGVADFALAPKHDIYNVMRSAAADIGAVEAQ